MLKFFSRKFIAALAIITIASVALFLGKVSGMEWLAAANVALGLYLGANVAQKATKKGAAECSPEFGSSLSESR